LIIAVLAGVNVAQAQEVEFGACVHLALNRSDAASVTAALQKGGFASFRDDVFWSAIEQKPAELNFPPNFEQLDRAVTAMHASGGRPLLILDYGNPFYDHGGLVVSPQATEAFERYVRFVVRHFGRRVEQYEVWNEWSGGFGSVPKVPAGDAAAYARLLERTYRTIKAENPHATVVGGAVAGTDGAWSDAFFKAGGLRYLDAFSVHSYTLFHLHSNPEVAIKFLDYIHQSMQAAEPSRSIPVLVTEMGWPTSRGGHGVSETQAGSNLVRFLALAMARPWVRGVWWYDLIDDGDSDADAEQRFGLLHTQLAPKPAFLLAQAMAPLLAHRADVHSYRVEGGGYAVTGRNRDEHWLIAWKLEPELRNWSEGIAEATDEGHAYDWTGAALPEDGSPRFWKQVNDQWLPVSMPQ
jgi:hypothetical protein